MPAALAGEESVLGKAFYEIAHRVVSRAREIARAETDVLEIS
jgi:hypothetical protein